MADAPAIGKAVRQARRGPWLARIARIGIASKGIVYITLGILALQVAAGDRNGAPDSHDAVATLSTKPFGTALLAVIAIGLLGYFVWRMLQTFADVDGDGSGPRGVVMRVGSFVSGIVYGGLALFTLGLLTHSGAGEGASEQHWTARLLAAPLGEWWVFLIAASILGYAGFELYRAWTLEFRQELKVHQMSGFESEWATRAGRIGMTARAGVLTLMGWFLLRAAAQRDASEARGVGGALAALAGHTYGEWLLGAAAVGVGFYGIYQLIEARHRRVRT